MNLHEDLEQQVKDAYDYDKFCAKLQANADKYADHYTPEYNALMAEADEHERAAFWWHREVVYSAYEDPNEAYYESRRNYHRAEVKRIAALADQMPDEEKFID